MHLTIRQKNLEVTSSLRNYIQGKVVTPLEKIVKSVGATELPVLDLEIGRTTRHHKKGNVYRAAANLKLGKKLFRAEVEDGDIHTCCDILREELEREVLHFKEGARARDLRMARRIKKDLRFDPAARLYRKGRIRNEGN